MKYLQFQAKQEISRTNAARVAFGTVVGFWAIYGATSFWRPSEPEAQSCTACCVLPDPWEELRPVPLPEDELAIRQNRVRDSFDRSFAGDDVREPKNLPTLAPPPARAKGVYGSAIEIAVEAKQVGN